MVKIWWNLKRKKRIWESKLEFIRCWEEWIQRRFVKLYLDCSFCLGDLDFLLLLCFFMDIIIYRLLLFGLLVGPLSLLCIMWNRINVNRELMSLCFRNFCFFWLLVWFLFVCILLWMVKRIFLNLKLNILLSHCSLLWFSFLLSAIYILYLQSKKKIYTPPRPPLIFFFFWV